MMEFEEVSVIENQEVVKPSANLPVKKDVIGSMPTKIEVRVLEEEPIVLQEQKSQTNQPEIIEDSVKETFDNELQKEDKEESVENNTEDDVIDEIESITAKLTDAITKLNFKFDVDEDI